MQDSSHSRRTELTFRKKGTIDHTYGFDYNNNYLGQSGSCGIGYDGGSCQVTIDQVSVSLGSRSISS